MASYKSFTLKGGARHQFVNREQQGTPSPALYSRIMRVVLARSTVARSIHAGMAFICSYIERVTSPTRKNHFGGRFEGWRWCNW